ncbi:uncharacterized protein MYCFIDRAFT_150057 [Pseudocercospora fijiensis CIRAD86]|uniref:Major facilitator superfamily (MFS) profile domain-containing protein n=1 Tax=Pseudocercospora fijiensis (strain CIRAD86) TaxID=383855 RepID=N1QCK2_PSEFD|nr:uncharacterized protein MYCFIDRAFT_150057 [Pseudocercospora fijiensis CIRAD86]EME89442.1 hypothetical protein MYCFIDRAFT_150057 [Pseudocercospora fijiensis CIRAD86]
MAAGGRQNGVQQQQQQQQQQLPPENGKQAGPSPPRNSAPPPPPPPPPPNGGYGWVCTVCCATINAHTWGLNSSYGVFLAHYLQNNTFPGATYLEYAFVGSLSISCAMLISPVATLSTRYFGTKVSLGIGIVLESASLIGASFASEIWQLFLSQGICFGFGMGFLFVASVGIPAQWFTTRRSLANGISACGSGFGGLVYSLAAGAMLKSLGLAWTFRVLGILAFGVNTICAILLRDRNKIIGSAQNAFDVQLFKRVEYLLLGGYGWFSMLGYVVLIFSLANYANAIGLDASQASVVSAILNLGQGLGRPPIGYFSDNLGRINMAAMMTGLCALFSFAIWIPAQSYGVLLFFAIVGGAVAGTFWTTIAPVAAEVVGLKYVPSALNLEWLIIVLPCTFSEPIALEIVGGTGSYLGAQLFVAFMYIAAAVCLVFLRGWKIGEVDAIAKLKGECADMVDAVAAENDETWAEPARKAGRQRIMLDFWKWRRV